MAVDLDKLREKYEDLKKRSKGDADWMQLEDGDNLVRFLSDEEGNFYFETGYHYISQGKEKVAVVCNKVHAGEPCYICDVISELNKSKDKGDKALAKELQAKSRVFFNVVDRADKKVKVLGAGNSIFKELLKYFADEDWGDLTDPETGHDVVINKSGSGLDTEYSVMPKPKPSKLGMEVEFKDLTEIAHPFTYEEQEQVMDGTSPEDIFKARDAKESKGTTKSKGGDKKSEPAKPPVRQPKKQTVEEQYAELIAKIDLDIPKARKLLQVWLDDEDRTEEELQELIEKYGIEEETQELEETPAQGEEEGEEKTNSDLEDEVQKALARFKKGKK